MAFEESMHLNTNIINSKLTQSSVCLIHFNTKTAEPIAMEFVIEVDWALEKNIG